MRSRMFIGVLMVAAVVGIGRVAALGTSHVAADKQWSVVNFPDPVMVKGQFVMGPVLIVHDNEKMERGEACTTFYRFDPAKGPQEALLSFHCIPKQTNNVPTTTLKTYSNAPFCKKLVEYQIAGDAEAHGIPQR